jgi:hypothetical protein
MMVEVSVRERLLFLASKLDVVASHIRICGMKRAAADLDAIAARLRAFAQDEELSS